MYRDPSQPTDQLSPYDILAGVGITPSSSMAEVRQASFTLMRRRQMSAQTRRAWDELRITERRAFVDFFFYTVSLEAERRQRISTLEDATRLNRILGEPPQMTGFQPVDLAQMAADLEPLATDPGASQPPPEVEDWPGLPLAQWVVLER